MTYGPTVPLSAEIHADKYRGKNETFDEGCTRFANTLKDDDEHFRELRDILLNMRFMGGGRTQAAIGAPRRVTAFNCFVSGTIEDSFDSIMDRVKEAGQTMRLGGGIGYDFSTLRPRGDNIVSLDSSSSGPLSFMEVYDALCSTVSSSGHRRGAQMGVLRVDHPDIEEFIRVKQNADRYDENGVLIETGKLTRFNLSIGITDEFMEAKRKGEMFSLRFNGRIYKQVDARYLWEEIMRSTWDWAEPGVLFIDTINRMNNLYYCETIAATNPCGEQPLPPYGACLLGSFNLVQYIVPVFDDEDTILDYVFDYEQLKADIPVVVRAMDNIHDNTVFPLAEQEEESQAKRRMGLGVTALANTGEILGYEYGSPEFLQWTETTLEVLRDEVYNASIELAKEKGAFPVYEAKQYSLSPFIRTLPKSIRRRLAKHGIRNSHLLSFAPTGTISLSADNVSGGIEPVFSHSFDRTIQTPTGPRVEKVRDYAYHFYGVEGKKATECTAEEHLNVLALCSRYVDSAVSKTINVDPTTAWEDFKAIYDKAWEAGCKGCTTFNPEGKRYGILNEEKEDEDSGAACYINQETGQKECS